MKNVISFLVGLASSFAAATLFLFTNFETVDAANQKWADHNQAIICETVNDLAAEKRALETRLKFDDDLTPDQRRFVEEQLKDIKKEIEKKDPQGKC